MTNAEILRNYRTNPNLWLTNVLQIDSLQDYHKQIALDVAKYDKIAIKAAHSLGKTWEMARLALWFFANYEDSIVITTAPTYRQVKTLLWGELREAYKKANPPLGGRLLDVELKMSDKHYAIGFSPQTKTTATKEQQGSSFQGFHSKHVMIIFDEATGVTPDVWIMAQGLLTSGAIVKFIAIANPTTRNCTFFECFSSPEWKKITINCFDSPNLIANGITSKELLQDELDRLSILSDEKRIEEIQNYKKPVPYLLTAQFTIPYVLRLGMDHPLVLSKVFGEFPMTEDNVLVQYEDVDKAIKREPSKEKYHSRFIGVDVARFGADKTVISELTDFTQTHLEPIVKRNIPYVTGAVINLINNERHELPCTVAVDATGLGAGVYDLLVEKQREGSFSKKVNVVEVHFGGKPDLEGASKDEQEVDKTRYYNLKAKLFDLLGVDLKERISLMNEAAYYEELPSIQYKFDSRGRIVIESKKDYKVRTGRPSPDFSDSLALANYGRYASIGFGSFKGHSATKPIVKQKRRKERATGVRIKEY